MHHVAAFCKEMVAEFAHEKPNLLLTGPAGTGKTFLTHCIAKALLDQNPLPFKRELEALDDAFISRRLSPGGCADLLAATYFLYFVCDGEIPEWI